MSQSLANVARRSTMACVKDLPRCAPGKIPTYEQAIKFKFPAIKSELLKRFANRS